MTIYGSILRSAQLQVPKNEMRRSSPLQRTAICQELASRERGEGRYFQRDGNKAPFYQLNFSQVPLLNVAPSARKEFNADKAFYQEGKATTTGPSGTREGNMSAGIVQMSKKPKGKMNQARKKAAKAPVQEPQLAEMSWEIPYGKDLTLVRFATDKEHNQYAAHGNYSKVEHKSSINNAVWFCTARGKYDPDFASGRDWKVMIECTISRTTPLIHVENGAFDGEAQHPNQVIIKNNEPGAYGIGREIIKKFKCQWQPNK